MTVIVGSVGEAPVRDRSPSAEIAANLVRLNHTLDRFRASVQAAKAANAGGDGDWQLNYLLFQVMAHGPMRSSVLADLVQIDPSTVSRQVATLVKQGLLERRADQEDGRAVLLHPTEEALARHERHLIRREGHYSQMLSDWTADDQRLLAHLLDRFTDSFEAYRSRFLAELATGSGDIEAGRIESESPREGK